jgi:hypothetical protein
MKKLILRLLIFPAVFIIPMILLDRWYEQKVPLKTSDKAIWILAQKNQTYDYAVIGSSRVLNLVDIRTINEKNKQRGINLGISGAAYAQNLLSLRQFLRNGNKIGTLLIQADLWGFIDPEKAYSDPYAVHSYLHLIGTDADSLLAVHSPVLKHQFRKYVPFFKYSEYGSMYPMYETWRGFPTDARKFDKTFGSELLKESLPEKFKQKLNPQKREFDADAFYNFEMLVREAQKNGIRVMLFTSPQDLTFQPTELLNKPVSDTLVQFSIRHNIKYYDFQKHPICADRSNFRDFTHLNENGALKFSAILADSLKMIVP